ncbi:MAG: glycosyltransferase family 4 protein [Hyphomicrobiaceae bacterium]
MAGYRIVHCLRAPVGGLFRHVRDLSREQTRRGHAVGIVCDADSSDPLTDVLLRDLDGDLELGVTRLSMPREPGFGDIAATLATRRHAFAMQADILHGHGAKGGVYARLAAEWMRRRGRTAVSIYTPHGGSLHYHPKSLKGRVFMTAERILARKTGGMLFESAFAARTFERNVGKPGCPVRVVHNGLRPEELRAIEPDCQAGDFVFVGELRMLKGVDVLIEATAILSAERPCRVTIVGAGADGVRFRDDVRNRGLEASISFAGALPAHDAFKLGRALVMPSRAESLPYVALEAAGAGLPLIASDVGGVSEIVDGTDTPLVPPGDPIALANAMRHMLEDAGEARSRASRLKLAVASRFTVARMTDDVLGCYSEAEAHRLQERPAPSGARQPA